ncbi:hypothetical protein EWM62_10645 [Mucilaginibacter terrigena]|uniref:Uncharacterized protein n=1 Tax=Mucilaginibacter terrigena TaxID=2492395 RepID=A0A4Q5LM33_9SPHI|nr:hypothetical protein [Mucilaginibacter terrigena]RYU89995.1 hypothetical protein EWM62_10645 [Mucilaginibacter terrigena]
MKYLFCLLILFAIPTITYCQNNKSERIALSKIAALPEVKSFMKNAKASKPEMMSDLTAEKGFKYYWVKVGLGNMDMFRTRYDFYVDTKTFEIFFLDMMVEEGPTRITLKQWRRYNNTKEFNNKMHTYKNGDLVVSND